MRTGNTFECKTNKCSVEYGHITRLINVVWGLCLGLDLFIFYSVSVYEVADLVSDSSERFPLSL